MAQYKWRNGEGKQLQDGWDDLIHVLACIDECCPPDRPCIEGTLCEDCWRGYLGEEGYYFNPFKEEI